MKPSPCSLGGVRAEGGHALAGCVVVDLGVPGSHFGNPFHKERGLTAKDCGTIAAHLANATSLRTLRIAGLSGIHHTWEQPGIGASGMAIIAAALPRGLEVLDISGNEVGDAGIEALASAIVLRSLTGLRELKLPLNSISNAGVVALAAALRSLPGLQLEVLNLDHNWIGANGSIALAGAIRAGVHVRRLMLAGNNVGERGGSALAASLPFNRRLTSLNLYSNSIGTRGAVAFATALSGGASDLERLSLAYNYIDADGEAEGAAALADAMRRGRALRSLDLRWNHFRECRCGSPGRLRQAAQMAAHSRAGFELLLERRAEAR